MTNESLLILSLILAFGGLLVMFRFFGKGGIYSWIAICSILANIEVAVLVDAFGMEQTLGNTLFAATFLATDILSEFYGRKAARKGVFMGLASSVMFIAFTLLWRFYTASENDFALPFVKNLFANTPRIILASLIGYAVSELFDIWIYDKWWTFTKKLTGETRKFLWLRNNGSTLISQAINIGIFSFGAFWGLYDFVTLIAITVSAYVVYVVTSLLDTPFMYLARMMFDKSSELQKSADENLNE